MFLIDILFYIFCFIIFIQVVYYLFFFGKFAFSNAKNETQKNISVSVIICAKNEAENLRDNLPSIINQDYPSFEIILINDDSQDDTLEVMEAFAEKNDLIKIVNVKRNESFVARKKYALTLGIKASKYDFLLFTDADCKAKSKLWISSMSSKFSNTKTIVLGYGAYLKIEKSFLNKLIRFETLLTATQYYSFAKLGLPYMGVGRNLAYRKDEFFNATGFINHMSINSGDDDLFINQVASEKNTALCYLKESFTSSNPETSFKNWLAQKRRHISTASHYKIIHKLILSVFYLSQLLFWLLSITLLIVVLNWEFTLILILIRFSVQVFVLANSSKKLEENDLVLWFPILEFVLIISQLVIFSINIFSKPKHWK